MSDVVKTEIYKLINKELEAANQRFPLFSSNHESYAVLLEEIEEAKEELINAQIRMRDIWTLTKENGSAEELLEEYTQLFHITANLAVEAVQCAAMARKGILSNIEMRQIDRIKNN